MNETSAEREVHLDLKNSQDKDDQRIKGLTNSTRTIWLESVQKTWWAEYLLP